jgi:S-adenosylmethionine decarboxylase
MHLTIDGFGGNQEKLASQELVRNLLDRLPESIGMTKITVPHVQKYAGDKPEDWGVSGFVMIAESHLSIHTFPERGIVWADLFSCKGFDTEGAVSFLTDAFDLAGAQTRRIPRGLEYDIDTAVAVEEAGPELVLA